MGWLLGAWKFLTSPIGKVLLIILAVTAAIWYIRWDAVRDNERKWEAKWQARDLADSIAEEKRSLANEELAKGQAAVAADLQARLDAEKAKPPVVVSRTVVKEVIRDVEKVVNAACTITNAFVWLRDLSFYPDYARLAREAPAEVAGANSGLEAAQVAAADGLAIGQCRQRLQDAEFNLGQWDSWYDKHRQVWRDYQLKIDAIRKEREEKAHVGLELEPAVRVAGGSGVRDDRVVDDQAPRGSTEGSGSHDLGSGEGEAGGGGSGGAGQGYLATPPPVVAQPTHQEYELTP